jgi:BirA family biotin operon repressor/biotin-[acetyl-CoA-carboxylase] ligase
MNRDVLTQEAIGAGLKTRLVGRRVYHFTTLDSTNDFLAKLAAEGAPEGTLVSADEQTAGRGRLGRSWLAPAGSCLLFSLLFRPAFLAPAQAQRLTMTCSLAAVEAIGAETGLEVGLKWPNDLLVGGRKLGGILTELATRGTELDHVVVGIGLNVNVDFRDPTLVGSATSIAQEMARPFPRLPLLLAILRRIDERYLALQEGGSLHGEWAARLVTLGQPVRVTTPEGRYAGRAVGVDEDGALLLRLPDGAAVRILAGDVTLRE